LVRRHLYPDADLAAKRLDFVQRLAQVYCPKTFCGATVAIASNELAHFRFGIFRRPYVLADKARIPILL
jgi:hypothetical protein